MKPSPRDNYRGALTKGQWQWQSNHNPWCKPRKRKWTSYPPRENYLIEKAYYEQKETIIGDYVVDPLRKIQKRNDNSYAQRPVRRVRQFDIEDYERSERYFETETPKTLNQLFGSLQDLVCFLSKRNHKILEFTERYKRIEEENDLETLNKEIVPELRTCLQEELKKLDLNEVTKEPRSLLYIKIKEKIDKRNQELISIFHKEFQSLNEFYACVLKAYTMNAFLYQKLNQYLRNDDWITHDNLLAYTFCVCKAFFNLKKNPNSNEKLLMQTLKESETLKLYRGTALDESSLSHYNVKRQRYFSWNAVTSTTTNRDIAKHFMYQSADIAKKKYPVLFIIDVPILKVELGYLRFLEVRSCSAQPQEDEVILPPGSAFEIFEVSKSLNENEITEICIELKSDFRRLKYVGAVMPGALLNEIISGQTLRFKEFSSKELLESIKPLSGNLFIQEIEFKGCAFIPETWEQLANVLPTMKRMKAIKFKSKGVPEEVKSGDQNSNTKDDEFTIDFVDKTPSQIPLKGWTTVLKCLLHVESLNLHFYKCNLMKYDQLENLNLNGLKNLKQLINLKLEFNKDHLTDQALSKICLECLQHLDHLTHLNLDFSNCFSITNVGIHYLRTQGLDPLLSLVSLNLNFTNCFRITEEGFHNLCAHMPEHLKALKSLVLKFWWDFQITLEDLVKNTFSQKLPLCFRTFSYQVDNQIIEIFCKNQLRLLNHITRLNLDFSKYSDLTDEEILCLEGLSHLVALTSLSLDFSGCCKITDQGILDLGTKGISHLTALAFLNLNFSRCDRITKTGISNLCYQGLNQLTLLTSLNPDFSEYLKLNGKTRIICIDGFNHLTTLTSLNLDFSGTDNIPDEGIRNVCIDLFSHFITLTSLNLNFSGNLIITDKGIQNLCTKGLNHLPALTSLGLNFSGCLEVKDEGILDLCTQGLSHLRKLESLNLNFSGCTRITDEVLFHLSSQIFNSLTALRSLSLDFSGCWNIRDTGILSLCTQGFKFLPQLTSLNLNFSKCGITERGMFKFSTQGLKHLIALTSLDLNFSSCSELMDQGVLNLCTQGLQHLTELTSLNLDFSTYPGWEREIDSYQCKKALKNIPHLPSFELNFEKNFRIIKTCRPPLPKNKYLKSFFSYCYSRNKLPEN